MHVVCCNLATRSDKIAATVTGTVPAHLLRPLLFRLGQDGVLTRLHPRLLRALDNPITDDYLELKMSPQLGDPSGPAYGEFGERVTRRLFGSDTLLQVRLMLAIANFCWVRFFRTLSLSPPHIFSSRSQHQVRKCEATTEKPSETFSVLFPITF